MVQSTKPTIICWTAFTFKTGPWSSITVIGFGQGMLNSHPVHEDIISDLFSWIWFYSWTLYIFRTFDPDQGDPDHKTDVFCQMWPFFPNSAPPLGSILGTDMDSSHPNSCICGTFVICYNIVCRERSWEPDWWLRGFTSEMVLGSIVDGKSLLAEVLVTGSETMDLDTYETRSVHFSQCFFLDRCIMQWISCEEGSERWSMSFLCSSVTGVKAARMNATGGGWEILREPF